jgi:hypothetical protein
VIRTRDEIIEKVKRNTIAVYLVFRPKIEDIIMIMAAGKRLERIYMAEAYWKTINKSALRAAELSNVLILASGKKTGKNMQGTRNVVEEIEIDG